MCVAGVRPRHAKLTPDEQARCFRQSHLPKCVVATNVAQTSITIPDIDAVVDSGMERRVELVSGVEGLYLKPISYADAKQRKGRAGRTKPGIYIDHCDARERLEFPKPEIQRVRLDQTVLRLAEAGFNAEELEFFHQPDRKEIHEARQALIGLGLMDPRGQVTDKGRRVAKMPVGVKTACMILEAERLGVVDTILKAAAIIETGEITFKEGFGTWREHCLAERDSDALAQVMVFDAAAKMSPQQMKEDDIMVKAYRRAKEMYDHLRSSLRDKIHDLDSTGSRENALRAIAAGMVDHLYRVSGISCINGDGENRQMNNRSVVAVATWIVGLPFDLEVRNRYGGTNTLKLVRMITKVNPAWLVEIAPHLVRRETGLNPVYDPATDSMTSTTRVFFKDQVVSEVQVADPNDPTASEALTRWIVDQLNLETVPQWRPVGPAAFIQVMQANRNALGEVERLVRGTAPAMTDVQAHVMAALAGARRLGEIKDFAALAIPGLATKVEAMLKDRTPNVTIAGRNFPVRHSRDGAFAPDISVEGGMKIDGQEFWTLLPREGVLLPSGRPVVLSVSYKGMTYRGQHVPSIQDQIRCALRPEQWNEFLNQARYSFSSNVPRLPFYFFGSDPFPDLVTYQYGQDENGQPLRAYGTLVYTGASAYLHDPTFESRWFNNWEEAIRVHRAARHEYNQAHAKREQQRKLRGY